MIVGKRGKEVGRTCKIHNPQDQRKDQQQHPIQPIFLRMHKNTPFQKNVEATTRTPIAVNMLTPRYPVFIRRQALSFPRQLC
jgi:hypothetical protein